MATGSYNTDAMRGLAAHLDAATSALSALAGRLTGLPAGAVPHAVGDALDQLSRRGHDMISDIADESAALAQGLNQAAQCYDDLDRSLVAAFGRQP
jgi:hypothetical protein